MRFGDALDCNIEVFDNIMGNDINCIPLYKQYITPYGEKSEIKLAVQQEIADLVYKRLS
jgi:hypothetical protein